MRTEDLGACKGEGGGREATVVTIMIMSDCRSCLNISWCTIANRLTGNERKNSDEEKAATVGVGPEGL